MARRKPRNLSREERELWQKVADSATPLSPARKPPELPGEVERQPPRVPQPAPERPALPDFRLGQTAVTPPPGHDLADSPGDSLRKRPVRMDRKSFGRMTRGKLEPEARIDLHGMTLAQAHPALNRFILQSQAAGRRLVLVITGKGRRATDDGPIPVRHGVLKHQVPQWLTAPPLGGVVLETRPAHRKHGGEGAYYVYLRRLR